MTVVYPLALRVTTLADEEYKVLQENIDSWHVLVLVLECSLLAGIFDEFPFSLPDFVFLQKQISRIAHGKSCDSLQEIVFQNGFSCKFTEWKRILADLTKLSLGSTYALGTQLKLVLCSFEKHNSNFPPSTCA